MDDPTRSRDQKRADTLTDLLLGTTHSPPSSSDTTTNSSSSSSGGGSGGQGGGGGAEVCVVVSLATLLHLAEEPGHLLGHGPIDAETARGLAADDGWRAWVADAAGRVAAVGSRSYSPPPWLARLVRAREPVCRMPGCRRRADLCDLDHTIPWPAGGTETTTSASCADGTTIRRPAAGGSSTPSPTPAPTPHHPPDHHPPTTAHPTESPHQAARPGRA